ncbi:MAG: type IX secretion system sortase PorU [Bacteroidaceae bacterium]|nr:type IX secretion system sortase PorU [Bacteroidaceae bacterium]
MMRLIGKLLFFLFGMCGVLAVHASGYVANSVLSQGKWVKISVPAEGVYQLTPDLLKKWGFTNPDKVRLYGYGGEVLSENISRWPGDDLKELPLWRGRGDKSLLFYAKGVVKWNHSYGLKFSREINPYSTVSCYFLTASDDVEPMAFPQEQEDGDGDETNTFPEHVLYEVDAVSWMPGGRHLYDSFSFSNGVSKKYSLSIPGTNGSEALLDVVFSADAESRAEISVNDAMTGELSIPSLAQYNSASVVSNSFEFMPSGDVVSIEVTHKCQSSSVKGRLDYLMVCYERMLQMTSGCLNFRPYESGVKKFCISGADANTVVWNVTDSENYSMLNGSLSDGGYNVTVKTSKGDEFVAVNTASNFATPTFVENVKNQNLHSLEAIDMVIIVPASGALTSQAERLADAHREQGLNVEVVPADLIYNEFSSGTPDATAYRRFMKMLYDRAATEDERPKYLLLFGDCAYDNRMLTSDFSAYSQNDFLLCYESENSLSDTKSFCAEDYFGMFQEKSNFDICTSTVQLGIGRIPARTVAQAKNVVDKTIAYMKNENAGKWQNFFTAMADDDETPTHQTAEEKLAADVEANHPDMIVNRIYWDAYSRESTDVGVRYPAVTKAIKSQIKNGSLVMNYAGHGGEATLSDEYAMTLADFEEITSPYLPMWVFASCNVMPFDANVSNIGESLILKEKAGAIAVMASARTVYSNYNSALNMLLTKYLLATDKNGRRFTIGDAVRFTKSSLVTGENGYSDPTENKLAYALLGDPAVTLALPTNQVVVNSCRGKSGVNNNKVKASAGDVMTVDGEIRDATGNIIDDFDGIIDLTVFDNKETVMTKGNIGEKQILDYDSYEKKIYIGSDSVRNGRFSISFPVPLDINYSDDYGLMNFYALNDKGVSALGYYTDFIVGGTVDDAASDNEGPLVAAYLNLPTFSDGAKVNTTPFFVAQLEDESGINTTGNGIGHDIVLIVDNDINQTYILNDYYQSEAGSYQKGSVGFSIPELSIGKHTLLFRAWDVNNNSSVYETSFEVSENVAPMLSSVTCSPNPAKEQTVFTIVTDRPGSTVKVTLQIFDFTGRMLHSVSESGTATTGMFQYVWDLTAGGARLQRGMYIYRIMVSTDNVTSNMQSGKIMIQ